MTVSTGDILRVVAQFLWDDGNINQNVFNAQVTGGGGPWSDSDIQDDAEAWLDNMYANIVGNMTNNIAGNSVTVYKWDAVGGDWDQLAVEEQVVQRGGQDDQHRCRATDQRPADRRSTPAAVPPQPQSIGRHQ